MFSQIWPSGFRGDVKSMKVYEQTKNVSEGNSSNNTLG